MLKKTHHAWLLFFAFTFTTNCLYSINVRFLTLACDIGNVNSQWAAHVDQNWNRKFVQLPPWNKLTKVIALVNNWMFLGKLSCCLVYNVSIHRSLPRSDFDIVHELTAFQGFLWGKAWKEAGDLLCCEEIIASEKQTAVRCMSTHHRSCNWFIPVSSPILNFAVRYDSCFSENLALPYPVDLRAQPIGCRFIPFPRMLTSLTCGIRVACLSSFCVYSSAALSSNVSRSRERWWFPQSKCRIIGACLINVLIHANRALADCCSNSSSVLSWSSFADWLVFCCARLFTTENSLQCCSITFTDGSSSEEHVSDLSFPSPIPYAFHTRIPFFLNSTL